jgi:hypothetical protein
MLSGWVRRRFIWYLKRDLVMIWKVKRKGECRNCGRCCTSCFMHDAKGKCCKIYGYRPAICRAFPLTPEDLKGIRSCGFMFEE